VIHGRTEHVAIEQAGEVAAHQCASDSVGGNAVQNKQFGDRQSMWDLVEARRSAGAGDRHQQRARRLCRALLAERGRAVLLDVGQAGQGFDVAHQGWTSGDA
jgi:hypothetical protein